LDAAGQLPARLLVVALVRFRNTPMHPIALRCSTGAARIDQALRDSIALIEQQLPDRVRGY